MATTARKKTTKKKRAPVRKTRAKVTATKKDAQFQVQDGRLVVRLSRDKHPEVFDADKLMKQMGKIIETYGKNRKCRDLVEFLQETEKSLEILLRNHLEDAMRKYLR